MTGLELTANVRRALDAVADRQLAEGEGPTVDAILLSWPHEAVQAVRAAVQALIDQDLVTGGCLSTGQETLHLTPLGLLASHQTGRASKVAEDMLRFFHRRMADPTVTFRSFEWSDLKSEGIAGSDADLPFIRVTLRVLDLAQERSYVLRPPQARWDVPSDIVDLRGLAEIDDVYRRAERRRAGDDAKTSLRARDKARVQVNPASAVTDAIGFAHVLAIGVSDYKPSSNFGKLRQCVHDAKEVAACFRNKPELCSSADRVHELTSAGVERPSRGNVIDQVRTLATRASADDRIVFYFSGHGHRIKEQLYLVPEDAWVDDDPDALISLEMVNKLLLASQAKIKIVILDACNTGPSLSGLKHPAAQWSEKFLAEYIQKSEGVVTLASSLADQLSSTKSPHPNLSLFTNFVVNALGGEVQALDDGLLTVESLFAYVSAHVQRVSKSHHRPQQPAMSIASSGIIVLADFRESRAVRSVESATPEDLSKRDKPAGVKARSVDRTEDLYNALSHVLGFLVESTQGNSFHWSKDPQHSATLQVQDTELREINAAIAARKYKITPLHRKSVIEATHETLSTLQSLNNVAFQLSSMHGLLWVSITKSVKQLASLFPHYPGESDNTPKLLVVGSDEFSLYFSELMGQLLQFADGFNELKEAAGEGVAVGPRLAAVYSVTYPFEPLTTRVVSEREQMKGALVAPALWRVVAVPAARKGWTKGQLRQAITGAIPTIDGGTGRRTRLPVVLRPGSPEHQRDDGTQLWRLEYKGQGSSERHEEQLGVKADGTLWFQRAHFWDAPNAQDVLELGQCAYDAIVFVKLLVGVGSSLGIASYAVTLTVEAPRGDMVVKIKTNSLAAKQPLRTARARSRRYETHIEVGPMTSLPDAVQVKLLQQLVDGIANEFELSGDPFFREGRAPYLEIDEGSIASVLQTFK